MSWSSRIFIIDAEDALHRLPVAVYRRLLQPNAETRLPDFAGLRVREASVVVECDDRVVLGVRRLDLAMVEFDGDGRVDLGRYGAQQVARLDVMLCGMLTDTKTSASVVDAADRFIARGGTWHPSSGLRRRIEAAACGTLTCRRVRAVG